MEECDNEDFYDVDIVVDAAGNFRSCAPGIDDEHTCAQSTSPSYMEFDVEEYYDEVFSHILYLFCFSNRHTHFPLSSIFFKRCIPMRTKP